MKRRWAAVLIVIAAACFIGALYYPVRYAWYRHANESQLDDLRRIRRAAVLQAASAPEDGEGENRPAADLPEEDGDIIPHGEEYAQLTQTDAAHPDGDDDTLSPMDAAILAEQEDGQPATTDAAQFTETNIPASSEEGAISAPTDATSTALIDAPATSAPTNDTQPVPVDTAHPAQTDTSAPSEEGATSAPTDATLSALIGTPTLPEQSAQPAPTDATSTALVNTPAPTDIPTEPEESAPVSYFDKPRVALDPARILPQYAELYALNQDLVGWLLIEDLGVDYPVMQTPGDNAYYLHRDFHRRYNFNGQLILDEACDANTPSYNLIIYGHNMRNGTMFGQLQRYSDPDFWRQHKLIEFDSLMQARQYVVVACFRSAQYREGQPGFRYALDFRDAGEYQAWMEQVRALQLYDTAIDCTFGDEFLTLSTCAYHVKNGRLVVVARRLREGETFENDGE